MNDNKGKLTKTIQLVHKMEDWLLFLATSAIVIFATLQILLRNIFDTGFAWITPMLGVLVFWVGMLGALVATREQGHIKINVLSVYLTEKYKPVVHIVVNLFSSIVSLTIAYYAVGFVQLDLESTSKAFGNVPVWITEVIMPVTFALMGIRFLFFAISHFITLFKLKVKS
ncbi:TRAP transporter small permease [Kaarinaea lacus]